MRHTCPFCKKSFKITLEEIVELLSQFEGESGGHIAKAIEEILIVKEGLIEGEGGIEHRMMLKAAKSFIRENFGEFKELPIIGKVIWKGREYPSPDKVLGSKRPDLLIRFSDGSTAFVEVETGRIDAWANGENFKKLEVFCLAYLEANRTNLDRRVILIGNAEELSKVLNSLGILNPNDTSEALKEIGSQKGFKVEWFWYENGRIRQFLI